MGRKDPPKVQVPQRTAEEKALLQQQTDLTRQLIGQGDFLFGQASSLIDPVRRGQLAPEDQSFIDQLTDNLFRQETERFNRATSGSFDNARLNSIGNLANRGILNSTTAQNILGDLESDRLFQLGDIARQSSITNLGLRQEAVNRNSNLLSTLLGQGLSTQGAGVSGLAGLVQGERQERMARFNNEIQNQQLRYLSRQGGGSALGSGLGSLLGTGIGLALAAPTGGTSLLMGGALGGGLGGSAGASIGGLF